MQPSKSFNHQTLASPSLALTLALTFAFAFAATANLVGQDERADEPQQSGAVEVEMAVIDDEGVGAPMIFAARAESFGDGGPAEFSFISPGGLSAMTGGMSLTGNMGPPDQFGLLNDPSVQKDLELVGEQLKQVQDLQQDFSRQIRDQMGDLSKGNINPENLKGIGEAVKRLREEQKQQISGLLLPHQLDRLQQVSLQKHMTNAGTAAALNHIGEAINLTDEQKERLKKREQELKKEIAEKVAKIREDAKESLLQELTATQREQLKELTGEKYKPDPTDWNDKVRQFRPRRRTQIRRSESSNDDEHKD